MKNELAKQASITVPYIKFKEILDNYRELKDKDNKRDQVFKEIELFLTYWLDKDEKMFREVIKDFNMWNNNSEFRITNDKRVKVELL